MNEQPKGSFLQEGKEPVIERIFQLVDRYPSKSAAARAWNMNINTLLTYYKRHDTHPTPRRPLLLKIAEVENVSVEWLLHGSSGSDNSIRNERTTNEPNPNKLYEPTNDESDNKETTRKLSVLLDFLSESEKRRLIEILARKGVETALLILDEDMVKIAQARPTVKKAALMLNDLPDARVREILAEIEGTERAQVDTLAKKAG